MSLLSNRYLAHRMLLDFRFSEWILVYLCPVGYYTLGRDGSVVRGVPSTARGQHKIMVLCDGQVGLDKIGGSLMVWASSPKFKGYKEFRKDNIYKEYCMPPWTCEELVDCANKCSLGLTVDQVVQNHTYVGGVARYAFSKDTELARRHILSALTAEVVAAATLHQALVSRDFYTPYSMSNESHKVFHMFPDEKFVYQRLEIASDFVFEQLLCHRDVVAKAKLSEFLSQPAEYAWMWEKYCNHVIKHGGSFACKQSDRLELQRCERVVKFDSDSPSIPEPNTLYLPRSQQFPCIDAYTSEFMFQHTAATRRHAAGGERDRRFLAVCDMFRTVEPRVVYCVPLANLPDFNPPELLGCRTLVMGIETTTTPDNEQNVLWRERKRPTRSDAGKKKKPSKSGICWLLMIRMT